MSDRDVVIVIDRYYDRNDSVVTLAGLYDESLTEGDFRVIDRNDLWSFGNHDKTVPELMGVTLVMDSSMEVPLGVAMQAESVIVLGNSSKNTYEFRVVKTSEEP